MTSDATMDHTDVTNAIPEYVLGALSSATVAQIDDHLVECADCAAAVEEASVIHRFAASGSTPVPPDLRAAVLSNAFAARAPVVTAGAPESSTELAAWEAEIGRFRALLDHPLLEWQGNRRSDYWDTTCVEQFDLSIRSMVCHLIAAESLRAQQLGSPVAAIPETSRHVERRTRAVIERHSTLPITETIDEFERVTTWTGDQLRPLEPTQRTQDSVLVPGFTMDQYTALRALETWTHGDDIRLALGEQEVAPAPVHISTMTNVLPRWISFVLSGEPAAVRDRHYRIELTGASSQTLDVVPAGCSTGPDVTFTCDAVEFCKLAGARRDPATFSYEATHRGDAHELVHAMADFELI